MQSSVQEKCHQYKELNNIMEKQSIPIVDLDGTYIYIQKSAEYAFQEMSISMHFDVTHKLINICVCACMHRWCERQYDIMYNLTANQL